MLDIWHGSEHASAHHEKHWPDTKYIHEIFTLFNSSFNPF